MVFLVLWRVVVILILVLVSVSVLDSCYHRVGSRSSIWILGRFVYMDCFGSFYTGVFCLRAFLLQFPPFISKFCLPTLLSFSLSSPFSFHGLMECAFCFLVMFFSYYLVLLEEFLCGEITVSCLLVVNNRDSGYLVQQLFFIFLRGFMILSSSILDSLSLLSCKNSVLL